MIHSHYLQITGEQLLLLKPLKKSSKSQDPLDPFYEVDSLTNEVNDMSEVISTNQDHISSFVT